jgi:hypothetical protein
MINIAFSLTNPWSRSTWGNLTAWSKLFSNSKAVEVNTYRSDNLIAVDLAWTRKCDHAGVRLELCLFGYDLELHFYDTRHWDYERERFWNLKDPAEMAEYKKQYDY